MDEKFIRDRLTKLRIAAGKSEREMSLDLGHSPSYVNSITSGRIVPSLREFLYICEYLEVTPESFFCEDIDSSPELVKTISVIRQLDDEDLSLISLTAKRLYDHKE